jgi:CheY-like chemotaxis protein/HPt (histidine-containing phosphotransfer) domain-containing protein
MNINVPDSEKSAPDAPSAAEHNDSRQPETAAGVWAAMSHEIRTPLMGVVGMLEILSRTSLTDEQRRLIATVGDSSKALMRIVDDVLDLAKMESARLALAPVQTDLVALLESCADVLANQGDGKGLMVTCEADLDVPAVMCDALRLRQVLLNFGVNAVKFTEVGHVALSLHATTPPREGRVGLRFTISDTGIGIPADLHAFLFKPFSQLAASTAQGRGGVGLGLAICRNLVEAMGGKISIDSVPGKGTRFHIDLSFPIVPPVIASQVIAQPPSLAGRVVIAVDADEPATQIAIRYLEGSGARVQRVKTLNGLALHNIGLRAGGDDVPVVIIGPDAEAEDVETATITLRKMLPGVALAIVWLHPRAVAGALSLVRRGVRVVRAHPMRRAELFNAVINAQANATAPESAPVLTRYIGTTLPGGDQEIAAAARAEGRVVLVAEDNIINQQVLRQQLAILGFDCDIAGTGVIALQMLRERSYLLLLCDCHMPSMDGFELTRTIRAQEKTSGDHMPIIAVTANAMPGESERCRAAGMDDYLAKPIEIRGLQAALDRWLDPRRRSVAVHLPQKAERLVSVTSESPAHPTLKTIDLRNLTAVFGNDPMRLKPVLDQWRVVINDSSADLRTSLGAAHWEEAIAAAHRIKGSAGIAGAHGLSAAAVALETALRMSDGPGIAREGENVLSCATAALAEVESWAESLDAATAR